MAVWLPTQRVAMSPGKVARTPTSIRVRLGRDGMVCLLSWICALEFLVVSAGEEGGEEAALTVEVEGHFDSLADEFADGLFLGGGHGLEDGVVIGCDFEADGGDVGHGMAPLMGWNICSTLIIPRNH